MAAQNVALFEDTRARQVGDVLTVLLSESTDAAKSSDTNLDKSSSTVIDGVVIAGESSSNLDFNVGSGNEFKGESASNQKNRMNGTIAVTVAGVMPNGNFYVQGEKWIQINQGNEYIRLRGIVRPVDISPQNTILSTQVADARISYSGTGPTSEVNQVGWLTRFFMHPIWPF
jgi:flagellar L-ring protein precursor FlgH